MDFSISNALTEDLERFKEFIKAQQAGLDTFGSHPPTIQRRFHPRKSPCRPTGTWPAASSNCLHPQPGSHCRPNSRNGGWRV
jgi:hypothetical protein